MTYTFIVIQITLSYVCENRYKKCASSLENLILFHVNIKYADQSAHPRRLSNAFLYMFPAVAIIKETQCIILYIVYLFLRLSHRLRCIYSKYCPIYQKYILANIKRFCPMIDIEDLT